MNKDLTYTVTSDYAGKRLDVFLANQEEIGSRNQALRLIDHNNVKVSGVPDLKVKASYRLRGDETVSVTVPKAAHSDLESQDIKFEILYQDYDLAVINKPAGIVTHPGAGHPSGTLVNGLLYHIKDLSSIGGIERPGLVHRLDKNTSGTMVIAKNDSSHRHLAAQFKDHTIHRVYWTIVTGVPKKPQNTLTSNLARHPVHRKAFSSQEEGKKAITHYKVVDTFGSQASCVHVQLETGRTHQIRVHMSEMGYPVFGDQLYGIKRQKARLKNKQLLAYLNKVPRHALHAAELGFIHPRTKQKLVFKAPWPEDLQDLLELLKKVS